jgi:hypothetical protein
MQPMLSIWVNAFPHGISYMTNDIISYTITLIIIGIFSFESSYFLFHFFIKNNISIYPIIFESNHNFFIKRSFFCLKLIFFIFLVTIFIFGPYLFLGIRDGGLNLGESRGIERNIIVDLLIVYGLRSFSAIILFKTIINLKINNIKSNNKKYKYLLFYCIIVNLIISNPLNAPRLWFGAVMLTSFFLFLNWNKYSFSRIYIYSSLILLLLFSGTDPRIIIGRQLLNNNEITVVGTIKEIANTFKRLPGDYNFDSFQVISLTTIYCEKNGYSFGKQLLLPMFFWVPRSIWPSKPIGTSDMVASSFDLPNLNISAPFWTEAYVNFGVVGIFFFFFFLGIFALYVDSILSSKVITTNRLIFTSFFAANMIILLRGDLTTGTQYLQIMFLFILLVNKFFFRNYIT